MAGSILVMGLVCIVAHPDSTSRRGAVLDGVGTEAAHIKPADVSQALRPRNLDY